MKIFKARATSFFSVVIMIIVASCMQQQEKTTPVSLLAERDSLYNILTDEEKRLPENSLAGLEVAEGLQVKLFASEPQLLNPTNMDIDARGRVWITEAYNYRPALNPENPQREKGDRIVILEDTDGDGTADNTKVFYEGTDINAPLGIAVLGDKVIVSCSPNVFIFTDSDGDDIPEKKEVLFSGIGGEQHDHAMHAFTFGPDGNLYFNYGNEGGQLKDRNGRIILDKAGKPVVADGNPYHQGMVFRSRMDGSEVEVLGHNFRNNYEVAVDSYGTLWQSDNDDDGNEGVRINYVMEYGNYGYRDEMTGAGWTAYRTNIEKKIPLRHWHLNDPGVVPNLLQTGAGSPTGILVYEGDLLPEPFRNQIIHADAGPNIIRAYPVSNDGAGYKAEVANVLEGVRDQWFRPADVTVAPDGSLFVADWYDPGVGGHQVGDMNRGRIYRIAPSGTSSYKVSAPDLTTAEKAVEVLKNPNIAVRYLAWNSLHKMGNEAESALSELWRSENPRFRARALWLLAKLERSGINYIQEALKDPNPDIRITGLCIIRQTDNDVIPFVKQLVNDKNLQVRREAAIALRHNTSPEAAVLWTDLALQHDGTDRWYLEALGIGADGQWDSFFAAWKAKAGDDINSPGGNDIIWRARTAEAMPLLAERITAQSSSDENLLRFFRAFDFHESPLKEEILLGLLDVQHSKKDLITLFTLSHLDKDIINRFPKAKAALDKTIASEDIKGSQHFVNLVQKYQLKDQNKELLAIALDYPESNLGVQASRLLLNSGGTPLIEKVFLQKEGKSSVALLTA